MTLQDLLNADVETIGPWLAQGFGWWAAELAELIPPTWRRRRAGGERPMAELGPTADSLRLWRGARFVERRAEAGQRRTAADLGLPPGSVLEREVSLPLLGLADLKRLVAHDLDRLTPFRPDQIYFDLELTDRDALRGRQNARLAVIERGEAEAALERAAAFGLTPRRLGLVGDGRALSYDFLPALRAAGRGGRPDRAPLYWWTAVVLLIAANLALLVFKDMDDLAGLRNTVDLQRPTVALALKLRQRVGAEEANRGALLARRSHNEPLRIIDAVTRAFPAPQWVQRLEWNGRAVRVVGFRAAGFDVLGAVRGSSVLVRPRSLTSSEATAPGGKSGFDLVAEPAAAEARR